MDQSTKSGLSGLMREQREWSDAERIAVSSHAIVSFLRRFDVILFFFAEFLSLFNHFDCFSLELLKDLFVLEFVHEFDEFIWH